uniref:ceramidase n=1 Tax=Calcidiscus leptoporus TaxID=127549 RepID=A0A7S0JHN9_9EUKA
MLSLAAATPHRPVPVYTIDLDLPPEQRFHVLLDPATNFNTTVWEFWNKYFVHDKLLTDALFLLVDARGEEPGEMQAEIKGLSDLSRLPLKFVQGIQMLYELQTIMVPVVNVSRLRGEVVGAINYTFHETMPKGWEALARMPVGPGCTGIIATNSLDGTVSHARNLDFFPSAIMNKLVFTGVFTRNGTELFRSQMVAGYVQMVTGMRYGADGFAIERNTRYTDHVGGFLQTFGNLLSGRTLNGWQLRKTLETCEHYGCAVERLSTVPYASTEYAVISGVRKGTILSRNPDGVAYTQTLGKPASDKERKEYIIITNFDFFWNDIREWFDPTGGIGMLKPRRVEAEKVLNGILDAGGALTPEAMFQAINARGVVAPSSKGDGTVFQAVINVELSLWNVSIPVLQ